MAIPQTNAAPHVENIEFGYTPNPSDTTQETVIVAFDRGSQGGNGTVGRDVPLDCTIENFGSANLTITIEGSKDNAAADAYAQITGQIRSLSATVNSVVCVPGGKVAFRLEGITKRYIRFSKGAKTDVGRLVVCSVAGNLKLIGRPTPSVILTP